MKKALVASFPRSGTHFLMNTLALNFGYKSDQFIDLDWFINPYIPSNMWCALCHVLQDPDNAIVKIHHEVEFFGDHLLNITDAFNVFYIYREAGPVMESYCKHVRDINNQYAEWIEGPLVDSGGAFAIAEPLGGMLRYQIRQYPTMLDKWQAHLSGWMGTIAPEIKAKITYVKFEELRDSFDSAVRSIGRKLQVPCPNSPIKPSKDINVVKNGVFNREPT